jgi:hypothetical protein
VVVAVDSGDLSSFGDNADLSVRSEEGSLIKAQPGTRLFDPAHSITTSDSNLQCAHAQEIPIGTSEAPDRLRTT